MKISLNSRFTNMTKDAVAKTFELLAHLVRPFQAGLFGHKAANPVHVDLAKVAKNIDTVNTPAKADDEFKQLRGSIDSTPTAKR